jgi:hypothetical protein
MSDRYYRKIIRITGDDSPNVRYAKAELEQGREPSNRVIIPGVLPWADFCKRRATWDEVKQCIGLDAQFYEGAEVLLYPPTWLDRANRIAEKLNNERRVRQVYCVGCDPGEGVANTAWAGVDRYGLLELISFKTPDTSIIEDQSISLIKKHNLNHDNMIFDRGGGGKQIADGLRRKGYNVRTVAFGEAILVEPKRGMRMFEEKVDTKEDRTSYKNARAEMYGDLRYVLDPEGGYNDGEGFGIPARYTELRRQLAPLPLLYGPEGVIQLPPKNRRPEVNANNSKTITIVDILGCSPDESDALVLAVRGLLHKNIRPVARGIR